MADKKEEMKDLKEKLFFKKESTWNKTDKEKVFEMAEDYKEFLRYAKTEREAFQHILKVAVKNGFKSLDDIEELKKGDKVYVKNKEKQIVLVKIGKDLQDVRMTLSHLDAPRLDLKQKPLYEGNDLCIADTHYYGGIKKYQWTNVPLSIHGTIIDREGDKHEIVIGEEDEDPVFIVPDLLPHLGKDQLKKKLKEAIEGEDLNILVGNIPLEDGEDEAVKLQILKHLNDEYGFEEEDLMSAEIEAVPAIKPRDLGFDKSMVAAYGQDDRGHAFVSLNAFLDSDTDKTIMACFFDKEEIGSEGNTSIQSSFLEKAVSNILEKYGDKRYHEGVYSFFDEVEALSMDVSAAVNPTFKEVHDENNSINLGQGVCFVKFTGSGGKYSANDANAEFVGKVRKRFNDEDIPFHPVELGKVDKGGGGTVAKFLSRRGSEVVDMGFPLLSMHSPYEISSKVDIYNTYKAGKAFYMGE